MFETSVGPLDVIGVEFEHLGNFDSNRAMQTSDSDHAECERSLVYDSVFSIFLVARYAQWFPMENHGNFGAPYLEF